MTGALTVVLPSAASKATTLFVDGGHVVFATSTIRTASFGEDMASFIVDSTSDLFGLTDARVSFDHSTPPKSLRQASCSIPDLLLAGMRGVTDFSRIERWFGALDASYSFAKDPLTVCSAQRISQDEARFLSGLNEPMTAREMLERSALPAEQGLRILCAFRFSDLLRSIDEQPGWIGDADPFADRPPSKASPVVSTPPYASPVDETAQPAAPRPDTGSNMAEIMEVCYRVEEKQRSIESGLDYYAVLEVERRADISKIRTSYRELARTFHPDRHFQLASYDVNIKTRLESIFNALSLAYATLSNPADREKYDRKLAKKENKSPVTKSASESGTTPGPVAPKPAPPHDPRVPAGRPAGDVRETVRAKRVVPLPPPVMRTPMPPATSSTQQPPKASPPPPAPLAPQSRPAPLVREGKPDGEREVGRTAQSEASKRPLAAEKLLDHGNAYLYSGDYERAAQAFRRGAEADPANAAMHLGLGRSLVGMHGLTKIAEAALRKALELDPSSATRYVDIAQIFLENGNTDDARVLLKRALFLDPGCEQAQQELERLDPKPNSPASPGFFKRIFGKK